MRSSNKSLAKILRGVPSQCSGFTFVPMVQMLPVGSIITEGAQKTKENLAESHVKTTDEIMSDGEILKAEIVYIKDSVEGGGAGIQTKKNVEPVLDHVSLSQTSMSLGGQSENTPKHSGTASMETTASKPRGLSWLWGHDSSGCVEVSSGFSTDKLSGLHHRTASPTYSAHVFPTPASSRESILSDSWDKDKNWLSSLASPGSLSRTVSPCSSVRSGIFSPAVVQIRKHNLAPGSSLVHLPQSCFSSCDSLASSVCPQSPPPRHRPPLTRLSLLTAILRKGRLPVLSASLQRPYTPCWPVNPVTLTFCNACSAASSVASIPLEFSSLFSSSASIDSQTCAHSEPNRPPTAPPPELPNEHSRPHTPNKRCTDPIRRSGVPRWERVISPSPPKSTPLPIEPPQRTCSKLRTATLQQSYVLKSPELKASFPHMYLRSKKDTNLEKSITPPTALHQPAKLQSRQPNSSLSKLRWLSEQLRSPPPYPSLSSPSHSRSASSAVSPLPPFSTGRCNSPQGFSKAYNLTPSRYTPIAFSGWPSPISSPTPTPSPTALFRELTPSPSFFLCSTPSPRPGSGISDCSDREGKKRKPHKIKSSYKSLAAIPTNTLLLDQQVIDEQVEREDNLQRVTTSDRGDEDTHAEMCSPAQLRQQSEELYAAIDEILSNPTPPSKTSSKILTTNVLQNMSSKSLGRETKYASLNSLQPSDKRKLMDSQKTKPGVIRPVTAILRLSARDGEEYQHNPFRETAGNQSLTGFNKSCKVERVKDTGENGRASKRSQMLREERTSERRSPFSACDLHIIEPDQCL
ncbi:muscular LMNA-interacting protein isoform X2 [Dunckerocampus dactyliophorus]|uniref:muscular LMNA-interacting protein isoform X2 n=1 Tax=Dunckerocampus dactyliophorus TaxID=161453 RepID=UPI002406494C|nr:muscular LMNA-interacting protein isoform X2 [Dunckerocampus dactyliophorus]